MYKKVKKNGLIEYLADLNEKKALSVIRSRLEDGADPLKIIKECQDGLRRVGERYAKQEYFIAGLVMAGEIFREAMKLLGPVVRERMSGNVSGSILLGTVQGDIHDIGKDIAGELLMSHGMDVHDLGVNVPPDKFYKEASKLHPDIVGISILLTNSIDSLRETIALLQSNVKNSSSHVPIIIGGCILDDEFCNYVGADYWVNDAMEGVRLCQRLLDSN